MGRYVLLVAAALVVAGIARMKVEDVRSHETTVRAGLPRFREAKISGSFVGFDDGEVRLLNRCGVEVRLRLLLGAELVRNGARARPEHLREGDLVDCRFIPAEKAISRLQATDQTG